MKQEIRQKLSDNLLGMFNNMVPTLEKVELEYNQGFFRSEVEAIVIFKVKNPVWILEKKNSNIQFQDIF